MSTNLDVANMILRQLGGGRFMAMTGAKHVVGDANSLSFQLPRAFAKDGINAVKVTLEANDTYTMEFRKIGTARTAYRMTVVKSYEGVYNDQLQELFSRTTGLSTRL